MKKLLIVVDYQNDFIHPDGKVAQAHGVDILVSSQKLAHKIQELINKWHEEEQPVLFVKTDYDSKYYTGIHKTHRDKSPYGNTAKVGTWGYDLYEVEENENDKIILKHFYDAFYGTDLEDYLKDLSPEEIFFC